MTRRWDVATRTRTITLAQSCLAEQALAQVAPEDPTAIDEGRLFVESHRVVRPTDPIQAGQSVIWKARREPLTHGDLETDLVLDQREGIVAASKPASWSSEPDRTGSALSLREHLSRLLQCEKLHIATRLDVGVSGLILAATDPRSRQHLSRIIAQGECHRSYVALVAGTLADRGTLEGAVEPPRGHKPRPAITHFECIARTAIDARTSFGLERAIEAVTLLLLRPETGHRHQLRIHCSRANAPVLGDRRYGGPQRFIDAAGRVTLLDRIYLHALATVLRLPDGKPWHPHCPLPADFVSLWRHLGGGDTDLSAIRP